MQSQQVNQKHKTNHKNKKANTRKQTNKPKNQQQTNKQKKQQTKQKQNNQKNTKKWDRYQQWGFMHDDILCVMMIRAPNKQNRKPQQKHQGPKQRV